MAVCVNCGRTISTISRECPFCHTRITIGSVTTMKEINEQKNEYDCKDNRLLLLSILFPIIGIVYYFIKKDEFPIKASSALGGSFIGIIVLAIFISLYLLLGLLN